MSCLPLKRELMKQVFEHCSQNECHRSELKTRDQNSLKDLNVRWKFKFSKCSTGLNIIHIPFSQGSTTMIKRFFVLGFLNVVTDDECLQRCRALAELRRESQGCWEFPQASFFPSVRNSRDLFFLPFYSYFANLKILLICKKLQMLITKILSDPRQLLWTFLKFKYFYVFSLWSHFFD